MIDCHCHLLPAIDDGADDETVAVQMAQMAVKDGIKHAVMTPHVHPGRWDNGRTNLIAAIKRYRQLLADADVPLSISLGGEVRFTDDILRLHGEKELPYIGRWDGDPVLLLEFPHQHLPHGSEKLVKWLLSVGVRTLIAHPERNREIATNPDKLKPFIEMGCLLQLTAMSVTGHFGERALRASTTLFERDWVTLIASDAHNLTSRPPVLSKAWQAVAQAYGESAAKRYLYDNPKKMLSRS